MTAPYRIRLGINYLPGGCGPFTPPFGDSRQIIHESWRMLVRLGVTTIHPAHGRPFKTRKLPLQRTGYGP